jgi:hypothetical protein
MTTISHVRTASRNLFRCYDHFTLETYSVDAIN